MIRFLLDTDHVSLQKRGHAPLRQRLASHPPDEIGVSAVTVEEILHGRPAVLARRLAGEARVRAYAKLLEAVHFFATVPVVPFDQRCEARFQELRPHDPRIGTQDLRIAATALANDLTVVTRNRRDFERVPGLAIEDWSSD